MSLDELVGLGLILYVLASAVLGVLRRGGGSRPVPRSPEEAEAEQTREPRSWEEELEELFERTRREQEEAWGEEDDRPWIEIEPIPAPEEMAPEPEPPAAPEPWFPREPRVPEGTAPSEAPAAPDERTAPEGWVIREEPGLPRSPAVSGPPVFPEPVPESVPEQENSVAAARASRPAARRPRASFSRRIRRSARDGGTTLREIFVLAEILGPPRALHPYRLPGPFVAPPRPLPGLGAGKPGGKPSGSR